MGADHGFLIRRLLWPGLANFAGTGQSAISVAAAAAVRIVDSIVRDNDHGLLLHNGATADTANSRFLGNAQTGIGVFGSLANTTTTAAVGETAIAGGGAMASAPRHRSPPLSCG